MKTFNILILVLFSVMSSKAQNISDMVRWSSIDQVGTARTLGVGSSFGSMGGDFSVININPSGIAEYRVSEFTFTPTMRNTKTDAFFEKNQ